MQPTNTGAEKDSYSSAILEVMGKKNQLATGLPSRIAGVKVIIGRRH